MYLASSKDILFIVLAFSVLWLTIFISWTLYYLIGILRDARQTVHGIKKAADAVENAMGHLKGKFEALLNIVSIIGEALKGFMLHADDGEERRRRKKE